MFEAEYYKKTLCKTACFLGQFKQITSKNKPRVYEGFGPTLDLTIVLYFINFDL